MATFVGPKTPFSSPIDSGHHSWTQQAHGLNCYHLIDKSFTVKPHIKGKKSVNMNTNCVKVNLSHIVARIHNQQYNSAGRPMPNAVTSEFESKNWPLPILQ